MLSIRLLGEMEITRRGERLELPPSRKTRGLLAYLALANRPLRRDRLCALLWDAPDDPKGALRWSLSKLRSLVNDPDQVRILATRELVSFDPAGAHIDLAAVKARLDGGIGDVDTAGAEGAGNGVSRRLPGRAGAFQLPGFRGLADSGPGGGADPPSPGAGRPDRAPCRRRRCGASLCPKRRRSRSRRCGGACAAASASDGKRPEGRRRGAIRRIPAPASGQRRPGRAAGGGLAGGCAAKRRAAPAPRSAAEASGICSGLVRGGAEVRHRARRLRSPDRRRSVRLRSGGVVEAGGYPGGAPAPDREASAA